MNIEIRDIFQYGRTTGTWDESKPDPLFPGPWDIERVYAKINEFLEIRRKHVNDKEDYTIGNVFKTIHCLHDDCLIENTWGPQPDVHTIRIAGAPGQVQTLEQTLKQVTHGIETHGYHKHIELYTAPDTLHMADYHSIKELETALKEGSLKKTGE